tara:strand:- start:87 stop:617 length:531 start_codon:yes stop_codon:yes gene_type:complete
MFASKTKIILPPNMNKSPLVKMYEKPVYKDFFKPKSRVQSIRNQYHRLSSKKPKTTNKPPVEANSEPKTTDESLVEETSSKKQNIANDQKIEDANKAVKDAEKTLAVAESAQTISDNQDFIGAELDNKIKENINKAKSNNKGWSFLSRKGNKGNKVGAEEGGKTKTRKIKKKGIKK